MFLCGMIVGSGIGLVLGTVAGVFIISMCVVSGENEDSQQIMARNLALNNDTVTITIQLELSAYQALVKQLQVEPYMTVEQAIESLCRQAITEYAPETIADTPPGDGQ
ncbi:MAG: hypothetical protein JW934_16440 [Anaerolineae bacterium]|nr:hypothetical protein [Anaerolineae bacterium]